MKIDDEKLLSECQVQTYKASGKGGQHVAKTDSAVRLIHLPTGLRVTCSQERSQYLNKQICLEKLQAKLAERQKKRKKRVATKKSKGVREKELRQKHTHSETKKQRRPVGEE